MSYTPPKPDMVSAALRAIAQHDAPRSAIVEGIVFQGFRAYMGDKKPSLIVDPDIFYRHGFSNFCKQHDVPSGLLAQKDAVRDLISRLRSGLTTNEDNHLIQLSGENKKPLDIVSISINPDGTPNFKVAEPTQNDIPAKAVTGIPYEFHDTAPLEKSDPVARDASLSESFKDENGGPSRIVEGTPKREWLEALLLKLDPDVKAEMKAGEEDNTKAIVVYTLPNKNRQIIASNDPTKSVIVLAGTRPYEDLSDTSYKELKADKESRVVYGKSQAKFSKNVKYLVKKAPEKWPKQDSGHTLWSDKFNAVTAVLDELIDQGHDVVPAEYKPTNRKAGKKPITIKKLFKAAGSEMPEAVQEIKNDTFNALDSALRRGSIDGIPKRSEDDKPMNITRAIAWRTQTREASGSEFGEPQV